MCAYNYNLFVIIKKKKKNAHTILLCKKKKKTSVWKGTLDFYFMVSPKANRGELIKNIFLYIWKGTLIFFLFWGFWKVNSSLR